MRKLNINWVSDSIGNDYKNWKKGDTVLISAQTGTGKTWFIKNVLLDSLMEHERILLVCNRTNLKRQLKKDLLKKYNQSIPDTLNELDKITTIANKVTITSYHAISNTIKESLYVKYAPKCDLSHYDYIVFDECHFIFSDGSFNNKTRFAYEEIIRQHYPFSIKVFISATMYEIKEPVINGLNYIKKSGFGLDEPNLHEYSTGNDYSYLSPKYFNKIDTIINLIKNDTSNEKWLIFISDIKRDGDKIIEELGENMCSLIKSGTESDELNSIINNSRFNKKVLICTKAMDNGININDKNLKNIVIMTWDRITFIQMLGRKRINIDNPDQVNLYIPTRYKKSFQSKLNGYKKKEEALNLHNENEVEFHKKYDNDLKDFNGLNDLFYMDATTGKIKINLVGQTRLYADIKFTEYMIEKFEKEGKYAFIREQLRWLGLKDKKCKENMIENVIVNQEVVTLENYLESIAGEKLFDEDQKKLSELIINQLITLSPNTDYRTKKLKPSTLEIIIRDQLSLPYVVSKPKQETTGEMRKKRYITVSKIS